MTDYDKWSKWDHPDAYDEPEAETGAKLAREMVDDSRARKHYMEIMKDMAAKDLKEEARFEAARKVEEEKKVQRKAEQQQQQQTPAPPQQHPRATAAGGGTIKRTRRGSGGGGDADAERDKIYRKMSAKIMQMQAEHERQQQQPTVPPPADWLAHLQRLPPDHKTTPFRNELFWSVLAIIISIAPAAREPPPLWILLGTLFTGCVSMWLTASKSRRHLNCFLDHPADFFATLPRRYNLCLSVYLIALCIAVHAMTIGVVGFVHPMMLAFSANRIIAIACDSLTLARAAAVAQGKISKDAPVHSHGGHAHGHSHSHTRSHGHVEHDVLD